MMIRNLSLVFVLVGDALYTLGQLTNESVSSTLGALFMIASTALAIWMRFKKESREVAREQDVKDREANRVQLEKDLILQGRVAEVEKMRGQIKDLQSEIFRLKKKLESRDPFKGA